MPTPAPKHDTQFQSDDGGTPGTWAAALVVDDSGNGNTLTQGTTGTTKGYILAASAGDFTLDPEFNITIRFNHNTANTNGYIYARQIPSSTLRHGLLVANASTTSLQFVVNTSIVAVMTLPGSFPGSGGDDVVVEWSGRPNPLTTGASDAVLNEVRCWNETDDHVEGITFTSAVVSSLATADLVFGGRHPSLSTQDYSGEVIDIHYGTRFRSTTESYNDWIATAAAPTLDGDAPIEVPVPSDADSFGDAGQLAGPVYALGAAATRRESLRTASPLVNALPMHGQPEFDDGAPDVSQWRNTNVPNGGGDYHWIGAFTYYPPVGHNFNRLKIHLQIQYTDPQFQDGTVFRVYSMSAHPDSPELAIPGVDPLDVVESYYSSATIPRDQDDGSTDLGGNWYSFAPIKIARAPGDEATMIAIAVFPDSGGPDYRIRAVHVDPLSVDADSPGDVGGLEFG